MLERKAKKKRSSSRVPYVWHSPVSRAGTSSPGRSGSAGRRTRQRRYPGQQRITADPTLAASVAAEDV